MDSEQIRARSQRREADLKAQITEKLEILHDNLSSLKDQQTLIATSLSNIDNFVEIARAIQDSSLRAKAEEGHYYLKQALVIDPDLTEDLELFAQKEMDTNPSTIIEIFLRSIKNQEIRDDKYQYDESIMRSAVLLSKTTYADINSALKKCPEGGFLIEKPSEYLSWKMLRSGMLAISSSKHTKLPSNEELEQLFDSVKGDIWKHGETIDRTEVPMEFAMEWLRRNKFSGSFFDTFKTGGSNKYGYCCTGQFISVTRHHERRGVISSILTLFGLS